MTPTDRPARTRVHEPTQRAGTVASVLHNQLVAVAEKVSEPVLAGSLRHFAAASGWAAGTLDTAGRPAAQQRAADLQRQARGLLNQPEPVGECGPGAVAATLVALEHAANVGTSGARVVLDQLLDALRTVEEGGACETGAPIEPTAPAPELERFSAYLRQRHQDPTAEAHEVSYISGGYSKRTVLVSATFNGHRREIVLRQVPEGRDASDLPMEFAVLDAVWAPGLPIAQPLWLEPGANALGGPFFASARAPGRNLGDVFGASTEIPHALVADLAEFLARLHTSDPDRITTTFVPPMRTQDEIRYSIEEMEAKVTEAIGTVPPRLAAVFGWLRANLPSEDRPAAIIHGDVGLHNVLVDDERLTAVLDWERAHLGDPMEDLTYLRPTLEPLFPWAEFVDLYLAAGGVGHDPNLERFYTVWQNTWRHVECVVLGEDFFHTRAVPMMIAGLVFGPRFLAAALDAAFGTTDATTITG